MSIRITARHMSGGTSHQHIAEVKWTNEANGNAGELSRADAVKWLDENKANTAYVTDAQGRRAYVATRHPANAAAYIQTYADNVWTDNLLALPTY